jgi:hypothetical protein
LVSIKYTLSSETYFRILLNSEWFNATPAIPPQAKIKIGLIKALDRLSIAYKIKTTAIAAADETLG